MTPPFHANAGLVVTNLSRRFGRRWAVVRASFQLAAGETLMLTGANGSGKTTLLRTLATALTPHGGQITLGGLDAWTHRARVRPHIALLTHPTRLYSDLSATDNLKVWARLAGRTAPIAALLARVGLSETRREPVRSYSAGMKRRLALARVLLQQPALLLLDEPFAALDPAGREQVVDIVQDIAAQGTALVVATHLAQVGARLCTRAVHMQEGHIVWRGLANELPSKWVEG